MEVSDDECIEVSDAASSGSFCHYTSDNDTGSDNASQRECGIPLNPKASEFLPCLPAPGLTLEANGCELDSLGVSEFMLGAEANAFYPWAHAAEFVPMVEVHEFIPRVDASVFVPGAVPNASTFSFSASAKEFTPMSVPQAKEASPHVDLPLPMKVLLTSTR